jgi:D-beta-D-heptose 7-phosphate kinase/D-beta-D-heptose 1-phosphate adenosyltransferase
MSIKNKIVKVEEAERLCQEWQEQGKVIVFTNGCFDILHVGHVLNLEEAVGMGDYLVVGLNSDVSVKKLKGPSRPYQSQDSRAGVLAGLESVRLVVIFEEETPADLIARLNPNVLVKGGDYSVEAIAGAEHVVANGGKVVTLPLTEGHSTTAILGRVKDSGRL